jgi:hypothetical protein
MSVDTGLDQALESATDYEPLYHYNGEVLIEYSSSLHAYTLLQDGVRYLVPGVTSVCAIKDKSGPLTQWAANSTSEFVRAALPGITEEILDTRRVNVEDLLPVLEQARFNFRTISKTATDIGHIAHEWLEVYLKMKINGVDFLDLPPLPEDPAAANCVQAALDWFSTHDVVFEASEQKIYSREYNYAGTKDWRGSFRGCGKPGCCSFTHRVRVIGDFKSSRAIYDDYRMQLGAYRKAWLEEFPGEEIDGCLLMRLDKEGAGIETLYVPAEESDIDFEEGFLGCLAVYNWGKQIELNRRFEKQQAKELAKLEKAKTKTTKPKKPKKVVVKEHQPIGVESAPQIAVESISTIGVETIQ